MDENKKELYEALKGIMKMIDDGKLVRDISMDREFMSFFDQSRELIIALTNANMAIRDYEKDREDQNEKNHVARDMDHFDSMS